MRSLVRGHAFLRLVALGAVGAAAAVAVAVQPAASGAVPASRGACGPQWRIFARAVPPLNDVVALSSQDVWAVGGAEGGISTPVVYRPVVVHWNGHALRTLRFPWKNAEFSGVAAASSGNVWAVGSINDKPLVVHWNGLRWQRVEPPVVRVKGGLSDVAVIGVHDVWVVGGQRSGPLLSHWDGRRWQPVDLRVVAPRLDYLTSIASIGPDNIWAAGSTRAQNNGYGYGPVFLRWDGKRWKKMPAFSPGYWMHGFGTVEVDIASSGDVWGVHESYEESASPVFARWLPSAKARPRTTEWGVSEVSVYGLAAVGRDDVWVVGAVNYPKERLFIGHWAGSRWHEEHPPLARLRATLNAVSAISVSDIWAVGEHLIVRYSC